MSTPAKRVLVTFLFVLVALFIALPAQIPVKLALPGLSIDKTLNRPDLNIDYGRLSIHKSFDLVLGLDLAGGSHLVFKADTGSLSSDEKKNALESLKQIIETRVNLFGVSEPNVQLSEFEGEDRVIVELPGITDSQQAVDLIGQTAQLEFIELIEQDGQLLPAPTNLTGADLEYSSVSYDQVTGAPVVNLKFTSDGGEKFAEITGRNVGKQVAIVLDGQIVSSPLVNQKIVGGAAQISGDFDLDQAKALSVQLNAGALPVSVSLVEQRSVGASLGADSVQKSVVAGLVGLAMVLVFMVLSYGWPGLLADISLIIFGILTLALYKLIPVVLTLPGVAGFLLSVGMAVDSNILIFERLKEERQHRSFANALEAAFGRAWDSIRDANIATLVTAFILANPLDWSFLHVSGPVRGFAITLALGIGISLFTGVWVTRNLMRTFMREAKQD